MNIIKQGCIEAINQGIEILKSLKPKEYTTPAKPILEYSIGSHFRHLLDLFNSIKEGFDSGVIDYNKRRRGHIVERDIREAIKENKDLLEWLSTLNESDLKKELSLKSEVLLSDNKSIELKSSLSRELLFASSHAVHHYAIISTAMKFMGIKVSDKIGFAPATASFIREKN